MKPRTPKERESAAIEYQFAVENPDAARKLILKHLEGDGVALYVNKVLDSSRLGDRSILPVGWKSGETPNRIGDLQSFKELVDIVKKSQYGGDVDAALRVFTFSKAGE